MREMTLRDLKANYERAAREAPDDPGLPGILTMIQHMEAAGETDNTVIYIAEQPGVQQEQDVGTQPDQGWGET